MRVFAGRAWPATLPAVLLLAGCTAPAATGVRLYSPPSATPATPGGPVADPVYPAYGNPGIDVEHYALDLSWDPARTVLTGRATIRLHAVRELTAIRLDFSAAYAIDAVTVDGSAATATIVDGDLVVASALHRDAPATLVVRYHGTPRTVDPPTHRDDVEPLGLTVTDDGMLWTMQEPYGASTWYPSNDQPSDKATYDIAITVPAGWTGVAGGTFAGRTGNTFRYASAAPVASYLTTLAAGPFRQETATGPHGLPITYWYRPGADDAMMAVVRRTPDYLAWLEQKFGTFPFPAAGVLLVPSRSAMETQQVVTFGDRILGGQTGDATGADLLHEFAHQWFGDAVTPSTWKDLWLNEGLAEWTQFMYQFEQEKVDPDDGFAGLRADDARLRAQLGPPGSPRADSFAEENVYLCPALMLDGLRRRLGDGPMFALLRDWAQQHRGTVQDRASFTAFVNGRTGRDFTAFINAWLDSPTTPAS